MINYQLKVDISGITFSVEFTKPRHILNVGLRHTNLRRDIDQFIFHLKC